jgi:hypothetical protein
MERGSSTAPKADTERREENEEERNREHRGLANVEHDASPLMTPLTPMLRIEMHCVPLLSPTTITLPEIVCSTKLVVLGCYSSGRMRVIRDGHIDRFQ